MLLFLIISDPLKNKRYRNYDIVHFQFLFSKKLIIVSKNLGVVRGQKVKKENVQSNLLKNQSCNRQSHSDGDKNLIIEITNNFEET